MNALTLNSGVTGRIIFCCPLRLTRFDAGNAVYIKTLDYATIHVYRKPAPLSLRVLRGSLSIQYVAVSNTLSCGKQFWGVGSRLESSVFRYVENLTKIGCPFLQRATLECRAHPSRG